MALGSGKYTNLRHDAMGEIPPQIVALGEFVADRQAETNRLLLSLPEAPKKVPAHMRRRARSWRPFNSKLRVGNGAAQMITRRRKLRTRHVQKPSRDACGQPTSNDIAALVVATSDLAIASESAVEDDTKLEVRVRKHWRRPKALLRAHVSRPISSLDAPLRWLETHIWHTKRARLESIWGFRLAANNNGMGRRALYRAAAQHCCIHDRSYMQTFELYGREDDIVRALTLCGVDSRLLLSKSLRDGSRRGRSWLRQGCCANEGNLALTTESLISPFHFLWEPGTSSDDEPLSFFMDVGSGQFDDTSMQEEDSALATGVKRRSVWLWIHPAAALDAEKCLRHSVLVVCKDQGDLELRCSGGSAFLELTGPKSIQALARAIPPEYCLTSDAQKVWNDIAQAASAGLRLSLPLGAALALECDPNVFGMCASPKLTTPIVPQTSSFSRWPPSLTAGSRVWNKARKGIASNHQFDFSEPVPVLIIFRPDEQCGLLAGIDLILPQMAGAKHLFLRCVFAEARTMGFRDRHSLHTEAAVPDFPFDFPETAAGQADAAARKTESLFRYDRRPPAKRVNFEVLGVHCPHSLDWHLIGQSDQQAFPKVVRPRLLGPAPALSGTDLLAVTVMCPARGAPQALCHLFDLQAGDFPSSWGESRSHCKRGDLSKTRTVQTLEIPPPPAHPGILLENFRLNEPLRKFMKRGKVRRRELHAQDSAGEKREPQLRVSDAPKTLRPLIGFITSGCFSYRHGYGTGVGAVAALPFLSQLTEQLRIRGGQGSQASAIDYRRQWVLLWARNTRSTVYFPVWVKVLLRDEGCG